MAYQIPLTINDTLESIARGRFVLPAIQRELVWAGRTTGTKRVYETSMAELVSTGVIPAGAVLSKTYLGVEYEVTVRDDGRLESDGEVFESLSQAARLLTGQKAVNGWAFWLTSAGTPVGDLRPDT